ncbi:MAG TPA: PASTA domain-containing protein [Spirochaetota bacterium]|nr:PASTA domain-containing protein [Spirochaetota bacterium]
MRFPNIPLPGVFRTTLSWVGRRIKRFWKWLTMRKSEVVTERDLWFFHTKRIVVVFAGFLVLSLMTAITFISVWKSGEGMSAVPDVTGMTVIQALSELQDKNLYGTIKTISDISRPSGIILDQEPKGGFFTREKRGVMLFINQPAKSGEVPNLVGKTPTEAKQALLAHASTNYTADLGRIAYGHSETIPAGKIAAQTPSPTSPVVNPLLVDIVVSLGRSHSSVVLPDLKGKDFDEAARWLALNNLSVVPVQVPGGAEGIISSHEPEAGSRVGEGGAVRLSMGGSKKYGVVDFVFPLMLKLSQTTINFTTASATNSSDQDLSIEQLKLKQQRDEERLQRELIREGDEKYQVAITMIRRDGSRGTIFSGEKAPGEHIIQTFSYENEVTIEIAIGGRKFISRKYQ